MPLIVKTFNYTNITIVSSVVMIVLGYIYIYQYKIGNIILTFSNLLFINLILKTITKIKLTIPSIVFMFVLMPIPNIFTEFKAPIHVITEKTKQI